MRKLLILTVCTALAVAAIVEPVLGASSSVSISDNNKQTQSFTASHPYHEQLLPAEDHSRQLGSGSQGMYQQQYQSYDTSKTYNPVNTDVGYSSAASAQAPSQASITFGSSGASAGVGDSKYSATVPSYDTPIVQDSYGNPKPMGGYNRPSGGYGTPSSSYGPAKGEQYAYQYQHYPAQGGYQDNYEEPSSHHGGGGLGGLFGGKGSLFSGFGGLSSLTSGLGGGLGGAGGGLGEGFGLQGLGGEAEGAGPLGGVAAVKAVVIAIKAIKGILKFKSFFLFGLPFLLLLPALLLFLPIPVISITPTEPAPYSDGMATPIPASSFFNFGPFGRSNSQSHSLGRQILLELTDKVLGSEECLERMICKLPQVPNKFQKQAKSLWTDYGTRYITSRRVQRGMEAYFEDEKDQKEKQAAKQRAFKCNQKFKCTNKFF